MNYGYQEMVTLMNMQDAGLLKVKEKKGDWNWAEIKKKFELIDMEGENPVYPSDIYFIFNGFAPLAVRLIDLIIKKGGLSKIMNLAKLIGITEDNIKLNPGLEQ